MGRAIEVDKRLDALEFKVNEILLMLDELANTNTTQEHIDLHEATKEEKTNDEGDGKSSGESNKRKPTSKAKSNKDSGSSK
jgi:hypothetical protein